MRPSWAQISPAWKPPHEKSHIFECMIINGMAFSTYGVDEVPTQCGSKLVVELTDCCPGLMMLGSCYKRMCLASANRTQGFTRSAYGPYSSTSIRDISCDIKLKNCSSTLCMNIGCPSGHISRFHHSCKAAERGKCLSSRLHQGTSLL